MNLLLIDSKLESLFNFKSSLNQNTKFVSYGLLDTNELLFQKINNLGIQAFDYVGFVFKDNHLNSEQFIQREKFISSNESGIIENNATLFIKQLVQQYSVKTIDFLGCNLLSYPIWKNYFNYLMNENPNLIVRASKNKTGNILSGGDWVLESTNEDVKNLYFTEKINNWNETLDASSKHILVQSIKYESTTGNSVYTLYGWGDSSNGQTLTGAFEYVNFAHKLF
jgi:hypothetical protein